MRRICSHPPASTATDGRRACNAFAQTPRWAKAAAQGEAAILTSISEATDTIATATATATATDPSVAREIGRVEVSDAAGAQPAKAEVR